MASRRVASVEPRLSAFWYQVLAFSTSAPSPATPSLASTVGSYVAPNAIAAFASPAWPVAQRAAFEAQIPTEVLRQDSSGSPVHHDGAARQAAPPAARLNILRAQ